LTDFFHDTERNLLIYALEDPSKVLSCITDARLLDTGHVAVPIHLYNIQLLTWLDLPVIEVMQEYDWPIARPWKPLRHQKLMSNFMVSNPRCFNLSDMGTMKTLSTLWAADYIMLAHAPDTHRALIVSPLSTVDLVWGDALFKHFMGRRKFVILHGTEKDRLKGLEKPADFYIINYDGLSVGATAGKFKKLELNGFSKALAERQDINIAIVDEASAYKDSTTKRHKVARSVIMPKPYFWELTGTPTPNGPCDAYGLAKLVNNSMGETYTSFRSRVMFKVSTFKWVPRAGAQVEASRLLHPAIRFDIEDCADLPPCTTQPRHVDLTMSQAKAYKDMKRNLQIMLESGRSITAANEAVARSKLIQISCGAIYGEGKVINHLDCSPRIAELKEVIEQTQEKTIIFAPFTSIVNMLNEQLVEYTRAVVNGEVKPKQRAEIFRAFQNEQNPRVLIADPGTMAHGLDLFAATTVVWYAPTDKTETYLQANKRIHRPGQVHNTRIVQISSTPIEREIFRRLETNESLQGIILSLARGTDYKRSVAA
jgi:SNF2 family DNA or RNA helicase